MSPGTALALGAVVIVGVLLAVAAVVWLEAGRGRGPEGPVYVIGEAVDFIAASIDQAVLDRVGPGGVQRIVEWSAYYLQGLAVPAHRRRGLTVVAGGEGNAIDYIRHELRKRGQDYSSADIAEVLAGEAAYLAVIGALGEEVKEQEPV